MVSFVWSIRNETSHLIAIKNDIKIKETFLSKSSSNEDMFRFPTLEICRVTCLLVISLMKRSLSCYKDIDQIVDSMFCTNIYVQIIV